MKRTPAQRTHETHASASGESCSACSAGCSLNSNTMDRPLERGKPMGGVGLGARLLWIALGLSSATSHASMGLTNQLQYVVECTYVSRMVEDHFAQQQHFMYDVCSVSGNATYAFAPGTLHIVNLPGDSHVPGERLLLLVRNASNADVNSHRARRSLRADLQAELHAPMWRGSARGIIVEQVISTSPPLSNRVKGDVDHRRELGARGRTLLSICMQYHHSTHSCTTSDEPWNMGVPQTHTTAAYNRLEPAWDSLHSRFYIIQMDTIARGEQMNFDQISCDTFMENEPAKALEYAKQLYPDANLAYSHTEFIVPPNLKACTWAGIATLGTYGPNVDPTTAIPDGPWKALWSGTTWCKGPGMSTRAHELGHNMGMMHSSSFSCDGFVEYGDSRCIMGKGSTTFNAPQRLTHGWISQAPQFATNTIYPAAGASLSNPPTPTSEICVLTPAAFGNHLDPRPQARHDFARWHVRRLSLDPQTSTVGDCSVVYLAKEGHEAGTAGDWQVQLVSGKSANLGSHSHIVISYDDAGFVSVHTGSAWGIQSDLKRPVLLDSITATNYAITFVPGRSWACPTATCWVSLSVCGLHSDYAEIVTSMSTIGVVHAESVAIDACFAFKSPSLPPYPPNKAPMPPPAPPPSPPNRQESQLTSASSSVSIAAAIDTAFELAQPSDPTSFLVNCTFVDTVCEDHFDTQQHYKYGSCSPEDQVDMSYPFSPGMLQLVNLHGDSYRPGERLLLNVRSATAEDIHSGHRDHRRLQTHLLAEPGSPTWLGSERSVFVEQILQHGAPSPSSRSNNTGVEMPQFHRGRSLTHNGHNVRSLLTICMQYPQSTSDCATGQDAFTAGVTETHTTASYGRLDPPWNSATSRFYVVTMPELNESMRSTGCLTAGCGYWPDGINLASYIAETNGTNVTYNLTLEVISCDDFLAREPLIALSLARAEHPDANLGYDHVEYLIPQNTAAERCDTCPLKNGCSWAGLGTLGGYNPNGNANTHIPMTPLAPGAVHSKGGTTWVKAWSKKVRAHELGHNMGMMHSSSYTAGSRKYQSSGHTPGGYCPAADGFVECKPLPFELRRFPAISQPTLPSLLALLPHAPTPNLLVRQTAIQVALWAAAVTLSTLHSD